MLKILQAILQHYVNRELPDVQAGFGKGSETEVDVFLQFLCFLYEPTDVGSLISGFSACGKFLKTWEYQSTLPASWESYMQVKKHQLEPDMEQWTGSKLGKEYVKAVYCHPAYLTYMQSTSCVMSD